MPGIQDILEFLSEFAPLTLAESWDNVGLLLGDSGGSADRIMTCLTLTPNVAAEAIREGAQLVVTHHPILFQATKRITRETPAGAMLLDLIRADVAVYSPHTAFDSAESGINQQLAERCGLLNIQPLRPADSDQFPTGIGAGRLGYLPEPVSCELFVSRLLGALQLPGCDVVPTDRPVKRVGIACGSAAEFLPDAARAGCDLFVTGEARFHATLDALEQGIGMILLGHYASERFALETLAELLTQQFPEITAWASRDERDPVTRFSRP